METLVWEAEGNDVCLMARWTHRKHMATSKVVLITSMIRRILLHGFLQIKKAVYPRIGVYFQMTPLQ
jgi:hypothetical protein